MNRTHLPAVCLVLCILAAACITLQPGHKSFMIDGQGGLVLECGGYSVTEGVREESGGITVQKIVLHDRDGDLFALLASPETPRAAFILAPGAGVSKEAHLERAKKFAKEGYAYMVLDIRGNGGETRGSPFDLDRDYQRFINGKWPEYYLVLCDIMHARDYLTQRYAVPVYAMGESNGGRYSAIAAALDSGFAGYIGVSTSSFGLAGDSYQGDARIFLRSVDPAVYAGSITPRSSWIFHSRDDMIIPYEDGLAFYNLTAPPHCFFPFNGTHGINDEVDKQILSECAQIYGSPR